MKAVLQPLNERAADIIINHLNLLESANIDPVLLQFIAHVSAYRVILKRWEEGATGEWSAVSFPDTLMGYVEREFKKIKRKQAYLLGIKTSSVDAATSSSSSKESGGSSKNTPLVVVDKNSTTPKENGKIASKL